MTVLQAEGNLSHIRDEPKGKKTARFPPTKSCGSPENALLRQTYLPLHTEVPGDDGRNGIRLSPTEADGAKYRPC